MADTNDNAFEALVEEGLQLYSQGKLDQAIARWRDVLAQEPEHPRALDYIRYVEDNREALESSFKDASGAAAPEASGNEGTDAEVERGGADAALVDEDAAERARRILEEGDPGKTLPLPGIEPTARMDVNQLRDKVAQTREQRMTPASEPRGVAQPPDSERSASPLVLVAGDGEPTEGGFEPQEQTPVGIGLPRPHISVSGDGAEGFANQRTPVVEPPPDLFEEDEGPPPGEGSSGDERVASMLAGARQLHEQGTYEGSLWLCERVLGMEPDSVEARELLALNRKVLLEQNLGHIGDATRVPVVQIPQHEIMWHKLDHRAGFLLSRIDGQLSYEDIIDVSGMGEFEASRILAQLITLGVIGPKP